MLRDFSNQESALEMSFVIFFQNKKLCCGDVSGMCNMVVIMCHLNSFVNSLSFFRLWHCNPQRLVGFAVSLNGMRISNGVEKKSK